MGSRQKKSTSQKILDLINPTPVHFDSDDEEVAAKVVDNYDEEFSEEDNVVQKLKKNVDILEDEDKRYVGEKVSRKVLSADREVEDLKHDDTSHVAEVSDYSDSSLKDDGGGDDDDSDANDSDIVGDSDDDDDNDDSGNEDINYNLANVELNDSVEENESSFQHLSKHDVQVDIEKGNAIRNQLSLWDNLLECRIQLQKCLVTANKLPQNRMLDVFQAEGGDEFKALEENSKKVTKSLLNKLINLREILLLSCSETKYLGQKHVQTNKRTLNQDEDEEIPSDSDLEDNMDTETNQIEVHQKVKRRKLDDYEKVLDSQHKQFTDYRNSTIQKWNDKTRVAGGNINSRNFSTFEQTTLKQIEQILSNRHRLIQRTRLKRSVYDVLGQGTSQNNVGNGPSETVEEGAMKSEDKLKEYDVEIFDDCDFYHQLLRELIERKSADVTDPVQLGRQWIEIQKLRSKMKRKIDVKATKGRRVRFVVHPKLVNFMAPVSDSSWNEEAKDELYNSLFGNKRV